MSRRAVGCLLRMLVWKVLLWEETERQCNHPIATKSQVKQLRIMGSILIVLAFLACVSSSINGFSVSTEATPRHSPRFTSLQSQGTPKSLRNSTAMYFFKFGESNQIQQGIDKAETADTEQQEQDTFQDGAYDADDPVEKIFSFFFGKRELNPMGMSRFGKERFPEQYPATKTEFADPVPGDSKDAALLRPFLKNTNLERRALVLAYNANRDGWSAAAFHKAVDKKGSSLVVCVTNSGLICGGYNPKGWVGYGEARGSIAAFLFILGGKYTAGGAPGIKLQKVGGPALAQMDMPESGPSFVADSLVIPLGVDNPRLARSKLGSYYERLPDGGNALFGKDSSVTLKDLKVYQGVYGKDEYIPFTDAEPFALY